MSYFESVINTGIVHQRVHEGRLFSGGYYNNNVADTNSIDVLIQTHATEATHFTVVVSSTGDAEFYLYTGTTFSPAGTAVSMANHNRNSGNTFQGTVTHTPTVTGVGTQLNGTTLIPGGTKSSGSGGSGAPFNEEFVLATSTNYLLRLTNVSGGAQKMEISVRTYFPNL